ncbi:MAG: NADPH-dependent FMN reductase [Gemmatimonadaceae bacterium]
MTLKVQVIAASTREGRKGFPVAQWAMDQVRAHAKFDAELVDLREVALPLFDEPKHPRFADYAHEHTRRWSAIVQRADAFVFVTPEYDHGPPASLLNALQYLVKEWAYKPAGFVSYGGVSAGVRSVAGLKPVVCALKMMPMVEAVAIPFFAQHLDEASGRFDPGEVQAKAAVAMLDELHRWAGALRTLR